jgi:hypothetical protein
MHLVFGVKPNRLKYYHRYAKATVVCHNFPFDRSASLLSAMTLSTPLKSIIACFAVAALVATAMGGSESTGLKGSRKLQPLGLSPSDAVNSIIANSFGIIATLNPPPVVPVVPVNEATTATNTVAIQSAQIFKGFNP